VFVPFLLGLTLFSVLWAAEGLSAHRQQKRMERRLEDLMLTKPWNQNWSSRTIPKPYQRKVR